MTTVLYPEDFIKIVLIGNLKGVAYKYHYLSFALIANGIEFLGKCLDEKHEFTDYVSGLTKNQFNDAIKLFPKNNGIAYHSMNEKFKLYDNLRNGFSHMLKPKPRLWLSERGKDLDLKHLTIHDKGLVLKAEDFFDDFEKACDKVIQRIVDRKFKHPKMYKSFLIVKE